MILLPIVLLIFAVTIFITMQVTQEYSNDVYNDSSNASRAILNQQTNNIGWLDNLFVMFFIGFFLIILAGAILLPTSPYFVIIAILIVMIAVIVGAPISNVFEDFANDTSFGQSVDQNTTKTQFTMSSLPLIVLVLGALAVIVIYLAAV